MKADGKLKLSGLYRLLPRVKPYLPTFLLVLVLVLLINAANLIQPYILASVIDDYLNTGKGLTDIQPIIRLGILYFLCILAGACFSYVQAILVTKACQGILMKIRRDVFRHILHLPMRILDRFSSGRLITRATNDVETVNEFFSDVFVHLFSDVFLLAGIVVMMVLLNWKLALLSIITVPLIVVVTFLVRSKLRRNFIRVKHLIGTINGFFAEHIAGMRLIQLFTREKNRRNALAGLNDEYCRGTLLQIRLNSLLSPLMEVINTLGIALLIWLSIGNLASGVLEIGVLYAFTSYIRQFFAPINDLAEKYVTIQSAAVSADRIFEILDQKADLENLEDGESVGEIEGKIEFQDVWFAYDQEDWVIKDLSFVLEPGQSAAIVGPTGTGKTTIIALLLRFYNIQRGRILLDGRDIQTLKIGDLRRRISIVLQDVFLFSGSIDDNVRLGNIFIDDLQINEALKLAQADDFIEKLDLQRETPVTERGSTFSAGQRQLLSFARAIARKPAIFILDEATAQIDTETEQLIQHSIEQVSENRTTIIIAHRLSTIRHCDIILVLNEGRLEEKGSHDSLMALGGRYASLIQAGLT